MAKRKTEEPGASGGVLDQLTWRQEKFVEHYVDNGGNATRAYMAAYGCAHSTADTNGPALLGNARIRAAIAEKREKIRQALQFDREKALRIYAAMATAKLSDFRKVLRNPDAQSAYKGLGDLEWALKSAKKSAKHGNEVQLVDRKAIVDGLWEKLGLGETGSKDDPSAGLPEVSALIRGAKEESGSG